MGSPQSKECSQTDDQLPQQAPFMDKPWRKIKRWGDRARNELKDEIKSFDPMTFGVPTFNIVLTGQVKSGKSSFYNSINSIFNGIVSPCKAFAGEIGRSLTREFKLYTLKDNVRIKIGDTMGIEAHTSEADIRNILCVMEGHVPDGYEFNLNEEFHSNSPGYIPSPSLAERAHCVGLVISAKDALNMSEGMKRKLNSLAEGVINRKLPLVIVLTHLDEYIPEVEEDVTKSFHSIQLKDLVETIKKMVIGLPENQIFPVINYHKDVELDDNMDVLLLYGLRCMIVAAQRYLENQAAKTHLTNLSHPEQEEEATSKEVQTPSIGLESPIAATEL